MVIDDDIPNDSINIIQLRQKVRKKKFPKVKCTRADRASKDSNPGDHTSHWAHAAIAQWRTKTAGTKKLLD